MKSNNIKAAMNTGQMAYGVAFSYPSLQAVEIVGNLGFDFIWIDGEHGGFALTDIEEMCIVAEGVGLSTMARVPNIQPSTILGYLDRGVMSIMGPHICTKADAEALVTACYYAPKGIRGADPGRVLGYTTPPDEFPAYLSKANDEVLSCALVEDKEGLDNLPDILTVEGLDSVALGPLDLSQSMGEPGRPGHPRVAAAIRKAVAQIDASDKPRDRDFFAFASLSRLLVAGAQDFLTQARETRGSNVDPVARILNP